MSGLQVKTRTNGEMTLQEDTIRKFKDSLRGELIQVDDAGYDDARSFWNAIIDRRPALVARCLGVADVVTCVNFARERASYCLSNAAVITFQDWPCATED
jgi:hypothetical protein